MPEHSAALASCLQIRREHQSLSARLLSLMRKVDALEARSAGMLGLWDDSSAQAATAIAQSLDSLEARLAPAAPSKLVLQLVCSTGRRGVNVAVSLPAEGPTAVRCALPSNRPTGGVNVCSCYRLVGW